MKKFLWILAFLAFSLSSSWADPEVYTDSYPEFLDDSVPEAQAIAEAQALADSVVRSLHDSMAELPEYDESEEEEVMDSEEEEVMDSEEEEVLDSVLTYEKVKGSIKDNIISYGPGDRMEKKGEKVKKEHNFLDSFSRFLDKIKGDFLIMIMVGIIGFIALICAFVILRNITYKRKEKRKNLEKMQQVDLFTIDENFEKQMKNLNYREAIRIIYVRTLSLLNKKNIIHWEKAKTPSEYYYEVKERSIKVPFKGLTHTFLLARYDNIEVSREMVEKALKFEKEIISMIK